MEATFFIAKISPNGDPKISPTGDPKISPNGDPKISPNGNPKINPSDHIHWSWNYKIYNATIFGANFHNLVICFSKNKNYNKTFKGF